MLRPVLSTAAILLVTFCAACSREGSRVGGSEQSTVEADDQPLQVGAIYAIPTEDGSWSLVRVLALDEHAAHLRSYTDEFSTPPSDVDVSQLTWFIGHMPVDRAGFQNERRVLVKVMPVTEEELEGYRTYLEAMAQ